MDEMSKETSLILPTGYFPPIIYYALMASGRPIRIEQMETFPKQTYRNRCEIMTVSGKFSLVVPVSRPHGNHTLTADIQISFKEPWQRNHWRAVQTAYNSSPYFTFYAEKIQHLIFEQETLLIKFNHQIIKGINELLKIGPDIGYTDDYMKSDTTHADFRTLISPKHPVPGIDYPAYPQVFSHIHGFIPGLSILDLLFNLGPEAKKYIEGLRLKVEG
jgi:hypothetical protein